MYDVFYIFIKISYTRISINNQYDLDRKKCFLDKKAPGQYLVKYPRMD